jgi:ribosome-binding factor A
LKAAEAIREVVAASILTELRDPRVQDVTVVGVKVSPDMREAKVSVSVMGDEKQQQLSLRGLQNAAGFLQSKIASRIESRHTPRLRFVIDTGVQNSLRVGEILEQIKRERREVEAEKGVASEAAQGEQEGSAPHPAEPHPGDPSPVDSSPDDPRPGDPRPGDPRPGDPPPGDPPPANPGQPPDQPTA